MRPHTLLLALSFPFAGCYSLTGAALTGLFWALLAYGLIVGLYPEDEDGDES